MKYKDYYNFELGNRDIYSHNDILGMTVKDLFDNELPLSYQYNTIGIPKDDELIASPNTHQYTNANGKLRWRSSSKTTEELLEEERQRNQAMQAQTQAMQSQLETMAGNTAPINNVPEQAEESPILDNDNLVDSDTQNMYSDFINSLNSLKDLESILPDRKKRKKKVELPDDDGPSKPLPTDNETENPPSDEVDPQTGDGDVEQEESNEQAKDSLENNIAVNDIDYDTVFRELNREAYKIPEYSEYRNEKDLEVLKDVLYGNVIKDNNLLLELKDTLKNRINDFKDVGFNKEDGLNLREEVKDRYDKFVNNKTDYSAPLTKKEQLTDKLVQKGFKGLYPASSDVYTDGMTDFSRARVNPNAEVMQNMDSLDEETKKALLEYGVNPNERGVHYNANSEISKKFANSPEVKRFFEENEEAIRQGKKTGDNFNFDFGIPRDELDRYASLQHAKMIGAYYDENGKKHGRFIDNVDYVQRHPDSPKDLIKTYFNNHGYNMQEKGSFENYYIVMDILLDDSLNDVQKKSLLQKLGLKK